MKKKKNNISSGKKPVKKEDLHLAKQNSEKSIKEELELLRLLVNKLPDNIFLKDTKGRLIYSNQAHIESMGFKELEDVVGKTDFDFFPKEMAERYLEDEQKIYKSRKPLVSGEEPYVEKDGRTVWHLTTKVPLFDKKSEKIIGIAGVSMDITQRKELEDRINKMNERLEEMTLSDPLTGARNRRYLERIFPGLFNTFNRSGAPLSIAMCDIDDFSEVNNKFGHHVGDKVLIEIVTSVMNILKRKGDLLIRYGGEEFLIVFFNVDYKAAENLSENIMQEIRRISIPVKAGVTVKVTWSMGIAQVKDKESIKDLLKRADEALYSAKAKGKNRIIINRD